MVNVSILYGFAVFFDIHTIEQRVELPVIWDKITLMCVNQFSSTLKGSEAQHITGLIPGLSPANERQHYFVMTSLIG